MAAKCGKCDPHEICEECPEWIFTLADLIMCMMGLFVILWCLKPSPKPTPDVPHDWIKVAAAVREAFGYLPDPSSTDPVDAYIIMKKLEQMNPMKGPGDGGKTTLPRKSPEGTDPESSMIRPGKVSVEGGKTTFDAGSPALPVEVKKTLDQVADLIRGHRQIILVKGHTSFDDLPEAATPEQRMDLSLRRAQAAADYLTSKRVEPDTLRVQGCSTFEPVVRGNPSPEAQAQNRRVEIETTASLVGDRQDAARSAPALVEPARPAAAAPVPAGPDHH
jgi:outer membrane protein OmpA-like peptidoglycan-associated protein